MYAVWKTVRRISSKILMKLLTLIGLILLTVFTAAFRVALFAFRFVAMPIAVVAAIIAGYFYFSSGFTIDLAWIIGGAISAVAMYFLLPFVPPMLDDMKESMKYYFAEPLIVRSPVKYTM